MTINAVAGLVTGLCSSSSIALASVPNDKLFQHESMPSRSERNIVTISDAQIPFTGEGKVHFVEGDSGKYLGALNTGY